MKKFPDQFRVTTVPTYTSSPGDSFGLFLVPGRFAHSRVLQILAVDGQETGWEHVSVSLPGHPEKCPSWQEMCIVKDLFWDDEEAVMQLHPPKSEYVNFHAGCLHLWRPIAGIATPPSILVGPSKK